MNKEGFTMSDVKWFLGMCFLLALWGLIRDEPQKTAPESPINQVERVQYPQSNQPYVTESRAKSVSTYHVGGSMDYWDASNPHDNRSIGGMSTY